jgi:hypothetical protein
VREDADPLAWLDAGDGYLLALDGAAVRARGPRGRVLASLPAAVRRSPLLQRLRDLREWLERHDRECAATVEAWLVRSLPVPRDVLAAVWPDPAWRAPLTDAVVAALDEQGRARPDSTGLLRAADPERGLGLVTLDGETRWVRAPAWSVPHPAVIPDLEAFRDLVTDLDVEQRVPQLFRETWAGTPDLDPAATAVHAFEGGRFEPARAVLARCQELGYQVSGREAVTRVWEGGRLVEARYLLGHGYPYEETVTGELWWADPSGVRLRLGEVGPVAFSEGMRMASAIYGASSAGGLEDALSPSPLAGEAHPHRPSGFWGPRGGGVVQLANADAAAGLLRAGGLLPAGRPLPDGADTVRARRYTHPALGDRPVVRLTGDAVAAGEDLALAHLGFERPEPGPPLAAGRARTPGFPGRALASDPASAGAVLAAARELERLARQAGARPGAVRESLEALGDRLARSLPQHLPAFYEEAARAFLEVDNPVQAAVLFGRAREAERAFGLEVDEERRRQAFLEFALAGALSTRDLETCAEDLAATRPPGEAYAAFRDLCLRRTAGGEPPWTGMVRLLRRLAAAAGLDVAAEDREVAARLLQAPATARAPAGFWRACRPAVVSLARGSRAAREALLGLVPAPPREADEFLGWWIGLLEAARALAALTARPGPTSAEWLSRLLGGTLPGPAGGRALRGLLARLAPALRAGGRPVRLLGTRWADDLDLLDLALELRVPLEPPTAGHRLELHRWASPEWAGEARRPLRHLAADPAFGPLLLDAIDRWLGSQQADQLLAEPGPARLLGHWLDQVAGRMAAAGLVQLDEEVGRLERSVPARALAASPEAAARILACDVAAALGRTLRGGLLDEFGWPALEEARAELSPSRWPGLRISHAWPNLVLADAARAIVVGPSGRLLTHDLRVPTAGRQRLQGCFFTGGQLLVCWWEEGHRAYWSGRPSVVFDPGRSPEREWELAGVGASVELGGGGRTAGGRAVHPGDGRLPEDHHLLSDGARFWRLVDGLLREYDPLMGEDLGAAPPPFLAGWDDPVLARCWLLPLPAELADNPLGGAGGLAGWRLRRRRGGGYEGEGVDGRRFAGALGAAATGGTPLERALGGPGHRHAPLAMVTFPGDEARPRPLTFAVRTVALWSPDGGVELLREQVGEHRPALAAATPVVPPPLFWTCLRPRDPAGSAALRRLADAGAARLLAAAREDLAGDAGGLPAAEAAVREVLPEITHPDLRAGLLGALRRAAGIAVRLDVLGPAPAPESGRPPPGDQRLAAALAGLERAPRLDWREASGQPGPAGCFPQVRAVAGYFDLALGAPEAAAGAMPPGFPAARVRWADLVGRMAAVALRAASPATPEAVREPLLALLELWAGTPFAAHPEWFLVTRAVELDVPVRGPGASLHRTAGRHYFLGPRETPGGTVARRTILEGSATGAFALLPTFERESERAAAGCWETPERLRRLVALVRERGPFAWRPMAVAGLAARAGLTRAEAALLLAGLPNAASPEQDFLGRAVRELLDLKVTEAAAARDALDRLSPGERLALLAAVMPDEPERLWVEGPETEALAAAARPALGRPRSVPDDLVVRARAALGTAVATHELLHAAADPDGSLLLTRDAAWEIRPGGELAVRGDAPAGPFFDGAALLAVASLLPWLFAELPAGHPQRRRLGRLLELARLRLANPDLLVGAGWMPAEQQGRSVLDLVPRGPQRGRGSRGAAASREAGPLVVRVVRRSLARAYLRPAAVLGEQDGGLARMFEPVRPYYEASRFLLGRGAAALAARAAATPVPAGGYEADPRLAAPALVAEVAEALALSEEAAALYLQVLTLAEPAVRSLLAWNRWEHATLERAAAEAVARGLLVEGRRTRAGRGFFLPGPWAARRPPDRPLEAWKLPLYEDAPLGRVLPLRPLHELFEEAWRRVRSGDAPRFEEAARDAAPVGAP